ncbi:unnamed protein product [Adineta ricciae]|nr:unnamed protein product [Adineta ricciae]
MSSTSSASSSSSSNRNHQKTCAFTDRNRTRFAPERSSCSRVNQRFNSNSVALNDLMKLDQLVDTLKSLKRLISHYFDQISKQGESTLAGDVRRVYRRVLLLYVKYRRRQNYEKRRLKQPIHKSDDEDQVEDGDVDNKNLSYSNVETSAIPTWTMKKIVSSQSLSFTRAGFDADHDGIEDFDEIALAATRDVANVQNHCVRLLLSDHQMKLPVYGLQTRWDSEIPKQHRQMQTPIISVATSSNHTRIEVIKKTGTKPLNTLPVTSSSLPVPTPVVTSPTTSEQELFLGSLARQLNEQTWQQLRSIFDNLNSQKSSSLDNSQL